MSCFNPRNLTEADWGGLDLSLSEPVSETTEADWGPPPRRGGPSPSQLRQAGRSSADGLTLRAQPQSMLLVTTRGDAA